MRVYVLCREERFQTAGWPARWMLAARLTRTLQLIGELAESYVVACPQVNE